jgi:uncharacterized protein YcbK (DUF882 family)
MLKFLLGLLGLKKEAKIITKQKDRKVAEQISNEINEAKVTSAKNPEYKITLKEFLKDRIKWENIEIDIQKNIEETLEKINKVRNKYNKGMTVTSGLRTKNDQIRIYKEKGITDISKIPMSSRHLSGEAIDIFDPKKELQKWCKENEKFLEEIGLWMEDFSATPNWCHFQTKPPKSGKRWFLP